MDSDHAFNIFMQARQTAVPTAPSKRTSRPDKRAAAEKAVTLFTQTLPTESSHKIKPSDAGSKPL